MWLFTISRTSRLVQKSTSAVEPGPRRATYIGTIGASSCEMSGLIASLRCSIDHPAQLRKQDIRRSLAFATIDVFARQLGCHVENQFLKSPPGPIWIEVD